MTFLDDPVFQADNLTFGTVTNVDLYYRVLHIPTCHYINNNQIYSGKALLELQTAIQTRNEHKFWNLRYRFEAETGFKLYDCSIDEFSVVQFRR